MEVKTVADHEGFSFIWTIRNYNYCFWNGYVRVVSPKFVLNEKDNDEWCLLIVPSRGFQGDKIYLALRRCSANTGFRKMTLNIALRNGKHIFEKGLEDWIVLIQERLKISRIGKLQIKREELDAYLKDDSLTLKFRIWKLDDDVLATRHCYARTVIGVERVTVPCTSIKDSSWKYGESISAQAIAFPPFFTMRLFLTKKTYADNQIIIEIKMDGQFRKCFSTCEISLISADGEVAYSIREEAKLDDPNVIWAFPFIHVSKLLNNKQLYLPSGILSLRCSFVVCSTVFATYNKIERTEYGTPNIQQMQCQTTDLNFPGSLLGSLQRFYEEGKFCDLIIRSPNEEFRVHKNILCASSEVFTAMFECDMKESQTSVVEIKDIDDDTISKMLLFMYTNNVGEDFKLETALNLYFAADKYGITALRKKCSDFLKDNFAGSNICDILVLADLHQDQELKSAARKFIFENSCRVIDSKEWKKFMLERVCLASETMHALLRRFSLS